MLAFRHGSVLRVFVGNGVLGFGNGRSRRAGNRHDFGRLRQRLERRWFRRLNSGLRLSRGRSGLGLRLSRLGLGWGLRLGFGMLKDPLEGSLTVVARSRQRFHGPLLRKAQLHQHIDVLATRDTGLSRRRGRRRGGRRNGRSWRAAGGAREDVHCIPQSASGANPSSAIGQHGSGRRGHASWSGRLGGIAHLAAARGIAVGVGARRTIPGHVLVLGLAGKTN